MIGYSPNQLTDGYCLMVYAVSPVGTYVTLFLGEIQLCTAASQWG